MFTLLDLLFRCIFIPSCLVFCINSFARDKEFKKVMRIILRSVLRPILIPILANKNKKTIKATGRPIPRYSNSLN